MKPISVTLVRGNAERIACAVVWIAIFLATYARAQTEAPRPVAQTPAPSPSPATKTTLCVWTGFAIDEKMANYVTYNRSRLPFCCRNCTATFNGFPKEKKLNIIRLWKLRIALRDVQTKEKKLLQDIEAIGDPRR